MSKYTMTIRELISTFSREEVKSWFTDFDLHEFLTDDEIQTIEEAGVWNKERLSERIITHFYLREIGQETPGAFMLMANDLMREIMETYAPIIYSASIKYDPLINVNFTEEYERTSDNTSSSNSSSENNGSTLTVSSDTPQGQINKEEILQGKYATGTSASESGNKITDTTSTKGNGNEHYIKTTKGNSGVSATAQKMIEQYRDLIRAINTEIVYKLEPLFMGIY